MEFTGLDLKIVVGSAVFFVLISFVFPAIGFTPPDVKQEGIPQYNETNEAFDYLKNLERPERPQRPSEGTLRYVDDQQVYQDNRRIWLIGSTENGGYEITLTNNGTINDPAASLFLNEYDGTSFVGSNSTEMENTTEFDSLNRDGYVIAFENVQYENVGQPNMTMTVDWRIAETPVGSSTIGSIPFVGAAYTAVYEAIQGVISIIALALQTAWYFIQIVTVGTVGVLTSLYNVLAFIVSVFGWVIGRYSGVISNAPNEWAALFISLPGLVLSLEFMKGILIVFSLIRGGS